MVAQPTSAISVVSRAPPWCKPGDERMAWALAACVSFLCVFVFSLFCGHPSMPASPLGGAAHGHRYIFLSPLHLPFFAVLVMSHHSFKSLYHILLSFGPSLPREALRMATVGGAVNLGRGDVLGQVRQPLVRLAAQPYIRHAAL